MSAAPAHVHVTRDDIERKFRELQGGVDQAADSARTVAVLVGAVAAVVVVGVAFWLGRRKGRSTSTIVEVRRV
jgi:hypothetical protein